MQAARPRALPTTPGRASRRRASTIKGWRVGAVGIRPGMYWVPVVLGAALLWFCGPALATSWTVGLGAGSSGGVQAQPTPSAPAVPGRRLHEEERNDDRRQLDRRGARLDLHGLRIHNLRWNRLHRGRKRRHRNIVEKRQPGNRHVLVRGRSRRGNQLGERELDSDRTDHDHVQVRTAVTSRPELAPVAVVLSECPISPDGPPSGRGRGPLTRPSGPRKGSPRGR